MIGISWLGDLGGKIKWFVLVEYESYADCDQALYDVGTSQTQHLVMTEGYRKFWHVSSGRTVLEHAEKVNPVATS